MKFCLLIVCELLLYAFAALTIYVTADLVLMSPDFMPIHVGEAPLIARLTLAVSFWSLLIMFWRDVPKHAWEVAKEIPILAVFFALAFLERNEDAGE